MSTRPSIVILLVSLLTAATPGCSMTDGGDIPFSSDRGRTARDEADSLLERAEHAIELRHYEVADSLVSRAERLDVSYGRFHSGPTPKKLRRRLDELQPAAVTKPNDRANATE